MECTTKKDKAETSYSIWWGDSIKTATDIDMIHIGGSGGQHWAAEIKCREGTMRDYAAKEMPIDFDHGVQEKQYKHILAALSYFDKIDAYYIYATFKEEDKIDNIVDISKLRVEKVEMFDYETKTWIRQLLPSQNFELIIKKIGG